MEHLSAPAQRLLEGGCTHRHDHELLRIHRVGGVCAAVQNVHHGHGQTVAVYAAQKAVQGHFQRSGCGAAGCNGNGQNGVCAQIGFILGAVGPDHGGVDGVDVGSIHAHHCVAGRCAAACHGAVGQRNLRFHSGVAAGVQDLAAYNRFNFQIVHLENLLNIISFPVLPGWADGWLHVRIVLTN